MKENTPLIYLFLLLFMAIGTVEIHAQTSSDKNTIKEWIIANKDQITLVPLSEYKAMSPSVKQLVNADSKTIIYDLEVTVNDIKAFENKNKETNYIRYQSKEERIADSENKAKEDELARKAAKMELYQNDQKAYKKQYSNASSHQEKTLITKEEYDLMSADKKAKIDSDTRFSVIEKAPK